MQLAAFGMAVAVMATLFHSRIVSFEWIVVGASVGAIAGYPLGMWVPMTAMPQRIALSHAFGALAATLVGIGEYTIGLSSGALVRPTVAALGRSAPASIVRAGQRRKPRQKSGGGFWPFSGRG